MSSQFLNLIQDAHLKCGERVAVIIDEYDKPLLGTIDRGDLREEMRMELKGFYSVLKSADPHLKTAQGLQPEGSGKKLFKVGVEFDHDKRNIGEWKAVEASR